MRVLHPQFDVIWHHDKVRWTGTLCPEDVSDTYQLEIAYSLGLKPKVTVLEPMLEAPPGKTIPHRFPDGSLCLYRPRFGEWAPSDFIATTIVPWASLWLFHYEAWLATGSWHGGGHEGPK